MNNQEAFVYCWTDHKSNMLYVGYHKHRTKIPFADGYICDGCYEKDIGKHKKHHNRIWDEYQIRPQDFTRMILAEGTTKDCHILEVTILKAVDAMHSDRFYNQTNGGKEFILKCHTNESRNKMKKDRSTSQYKKMMSNKKKGYVVTPQTRKLLSDANTGKHRTIESRQKQSKTVTGEGNPMFGKKRPEQSLRLKGNKYGLGNKNALGYKHTEENKKKTSIRFKGKPKSKVKCPYCGKIGGVNAMYYWHFDNCKLKKKN